MYLRRKLDKDIRKITNKDVIRYSDIVAIHNRHSINVLESPLYGENSSPREDA